MRVLNANSLSIFALLQFLLCVRSLTPVFEIAFAWFLDTISDSRPQNCHNDIRYKRRFEKRNELMGNIGC